MGASTTRDKNEACRAWPIASVYQSVGYILSVAAPPFPPKVWGLLQKRNDLESFQAWRSWGKMPSLDDD
jgi:predicted alpha/beta hydrolase